MLKFASMDAGGIQELVKSGLSRALPFVLPVVVSLVVAALTLIVRRGVQEARIKRKIKFRVDRARRRALRFADQN